MQDYLLLMHDDARKPVPAAAWPPYFAHLRALGAFHGGSAIGEGEVLRKDGAAPPIAGHLTGYIRVQAIDSAAAQALISGNPVFECGGSVEIRALPRD